MEQEQQREQVIQNIAEMLRHHHFTFEFKVKKNPQGIRIVCEVTQEDAVTCSQELGITLTRLNDDREKKQAMFPHYAIDTYLPKLIRNGHRVALCITGRRNDMPLNKDFIIGAAMSKVQEHLEQFKRTMNLQKAYENDRLYAIIDHARELTNEIDEFFQNPD